MLIFNINVKTTSKRTTLIFAMLEVRKNAHLKQYSHATWNKINVLY